VSETGYVVRSTRATPDGRVSYELVDLAGAVVHVTLPRHLTLTEWAHPVIVHALGSRGTPPSRPT